MIVLLYDSIINGVPHRNGDDPNKPTRIVSPVFQLFQSCGVKFQIRQTLDATGDENEFYLIEMVSYSSQIDRTQFIPQKSKTWLQQMDLRIVVWFPEEYLDYISTVTLKGLKDAGFTNVALVTGDLRHTDSRIDHQGLYRLRRGVPYFDCYMRHKITNAPLITVQHDFERRFISLNNQPRPHRLYWLHQLHRFDLMKFGFISSMNTSGKDSGLLLTECIRYLQEQGMSTSPSLVTSITSLLSEIQSKKYLLDRSEWIDPWDFKTLFEGILPYYNRSCFTVVSDTIMNSRTLFITEKMFMPILGGHPFIYLGGVGALDYIRAEGYQTFPNLLDESYDQIIHPLERLEAAQKQTQWLCSLPLSKLAQKYEALQPTLIHNQTTFFNTDWDKRFQGLFLALR